MNKFYVITNQTKDKSLEITYRIKNYIELQGRACVLAIEDNEVPKDMDCILVVGGDGTMIRAAREYRGYDVPIMGINMGKLGYLPEAEVHNLEESLEQIIYGTSQIEERMMLKGIVNDEIEAVALNDIVLTRCGSLRIITFNVYVNGELLNTYHADGIIVSTPTGTTAYNLSAGGPIVKPTASMIVITPICSHALNTSSIVLSADDEIVLEVCEPASVSFDGEKNVDVRNGDKIVIRKAEETAKLLKLSKISFLERLRKKMKGN